MKQETPDRHSLSTQAIISGESKGDGYLPLHSFPPLPLTYSPLHYLKGDTMETLLSLICILVIFGIIFATIFISACLFAGTIDREQEDLQDKKETPWKP